MNANLGTEDIDRLGKALVTLAMELWVVKDRQRILEAALADAGVVAGDLLDSYQPDEALAARLEQERAVFIEQLLESLER